MDLKDKPEADPRRRSFLRAAAGAGVLGTLATLAGTADAAPAPSAAPAEAPKPAGYHETDHIRKYYATARYW